MDPGWHRQSYPGLAMWLSHRDAAQLIERSLDAPESAGFLIVYGMSNNTMRIHEIDTAEQMSRLPAKGRRRRDPQPRRSHGRLLPPRSPIARESPLP